jgi:hypothetical protein
LTPYNDTLRAVGSLTATGNLAIQGGAIINNGVTLTSTNPNTITELLQASAGQSADLFDARTSNGALASSINGNGITSLGLNGQTTYVGRGVSNGSGPFGVAIAVGTGGGVGIGQIIRSGASQTGDFLQNQDSSGNVLSHFDANGSLIVGSSSDGNLIANPSFETNTTGWLSANGSVLSQSSAVAYVGSSSLKTVATGGTNTAAGYFINTGVLANSTSYTFSAYVYNPTISGVTSGLHLTVQGAIVVAGVQNSSVTTARDGWVRLSVTFTTTSNANSSTGQIYIEAPGTNAAVLCRWRAAGNR